MSDLSSDDNNDLEHTKIRRKKKLLQNKNRQLKFRKKDDGSSYSESKDSEIQNEEQNTNDLLFKKTLIYDDNSVESNDSSIDKICEEDFEESSSESSSDFSINSIEDDFENILGSDGSENTDGPEKGDEFIYEGSDLKVSAFNLIIYLFMSRFGLSVECINMLLKIIRLLLPGNCKIPKYLSNIKSQISTEKMFKSEYLCSKCFSIKESADILCSNSFCNVNGDSNSNNNAIEIIYFDSYMQLSEIIQREEMCLNKYYQECSMKKSVYDIMCGEKYKAEEKNKKINLCLFCDGTPLVKSRNISLWVMFAIVMELPQKVREAKKNILILSFLVGQLSDFNVWFERVTKSYKNLFDGSVIIKGRKVQLFTSLFDLPARVKAMNMISNNGYYACINCQAIGDYTTKVIYPAGSFEPRTDRSITKSIQKVNKSLKNGRKEIVKGIKGSSYLSNYINIRTDVVYDYMHLCCEGYVKRFLNNITSSCHHKSPFYIKKKLNTLNAFYRNIKVPHHFPRSLRDLTHLAYWKASEFRVFLFYTGISTLYKNLENPFFEHFCLYTLIIRRLCDNQLNKTEIKRTENLVKIWHVKLQELYGIDEMLFSAHAHLHLPEQVIRFGPLNRMSAFPFEGMIKHVKFFICGTRNMAKQIADKFTFQNEAQDLANSLKNINSNVGYIVKLILNEPSNNKICMTSFQCLKEEHLQLLDNFGIDNSSSISFFNVFKNMRFAYHSVTYDRLKKRCSFYCNFNRNNVLRFGLIEVFFKFKNQNFAIVSEFQKELKIEEFLELSNDYKSLATKYGLNNYFRCFSKNDTISLIVNCNDLVAQCIGMDVTEMIILTEVIDYEHS